MPFVIGVMGIDGMKPGVHMTHFRQTMAAPASLPEFKGNVVAVETAPFWDDDLAALQARAEKNEILTPEEENRLKAGVSNGGYHYALNNHARQVTLPKDRSLTLELALE